MKTEKQSEMSKKAYIEMLDKKFPDSPRMKKLYEVEALMGGRVLKPNEQWMFDNYWDNPEYIFRKDERGKLNVHKI